MCFRRSPELDLSEVTVGANKRVSGPSDMSSAISMPVKMVLAPLQQNNSSTWPHWSTVMAPIMSLWIMAEPNILPPDAFNETWACLKECYYAPVIHHSYYSAAPNFTTIRQRSDSFNRTQTNCELNFFFHWHFLFRNDWQSCFCFNEILTKLITILLAFLNYPPDDLFQC